MNERMPANDAGPEVNRARRSEMYGTDVALGLEAVGAVVAERALERGAFTENGREWPIATPEYLALATAQELIAETESRFKAAEDRGEYYYAQIIAKEVELLRVRYQQLKLELDIADRSPRLAEFNANLPTIREQLEAAHDTFSKWQSKAA